MTRPFHSKLLAAAGAALLLLPAVALADDKPKIDSGDTAWMLTSTALVLMMTIPGLALFYGGMVRKKNVLATVAQSFAVIEMQEEGARAAIVSGVGDADVEDGFGLGRHLVPHADRLEQPLAGVGDGRGAAVEARLAHALERQAVDQRRPQARFAGREGQQAAIEAGTDDHEVEALFVHGRAHMWKMAG